MMLLEWDPNNLPEVKISEQDRHNARLFLDSWMVADHKVRASGRLDRELAMLLALVSRGQ